MKITSAKLLIERELAALDVHPSSDAYAVVKENALAAADILSRAELKALVNEHVESLPLQMRESL